MYVCMYVCSAPPRSSQVLIPVEKPVLPVLLLTVADYRLTFSW